MTYYYYYLLFIINRFFIPNLWIDRFAARAHNPMKTVSPPIHLDHFAETMKTVVARCMTALVLRVCEVCQWRVRETASARSDIVHATRSHWLRVWSTRLRVWSTRQQGWNTPSCSEIYTSPQHHSLPSSTPAASAAAEVWLIVMLSTLTFSDSLEQLPRWIYRIGNLVVHYLKMVKW